MYAPPKDPNVPTLSAADVGKWKEADGILFGFPTRFGSMPA